MTKDGPRVPQACDFPEGTEFRIKESDVPLALVPGQGWVNWWGGHPKPYSGELRVDNNWTADSFEEWSAVVAASFAAQPMVFPFKFFDPVGKRWIAAPSKATLEEIRARYAEWEITGPGSGT